MPRSKDCQIVVHTSREPNARQFHVKRVLTNRTYRDIADKHIHSNVYFIERLTEDTQRLIHELHKLEEVKTVGIAAGKSPFVEVKLYRNFGWEEHDMYDKVVEVIEEHIEWCDTHGFRRAPLEHSENRQK